MSSAWPAIRLDWRARAVVSAALTAAMPALLGFLPAGPSNAPPARASAVALLLLAALRRPSASTSSSFAMSIPQVANTLVARLPNDLPRHRHQFWSRRLISLGQRDHTPAGTFAVA